MGVVRNKRVKVAEVLSVAGTRHLSKTSNFPDFRDCKDTLIVKSLFYPKQCFSVVENFSLWCAESCKWCEWKPFWTAWHFSAECQIVENLPNRFQRLITWAAKVGFFISQWNFYNFISQPVELGIKLTVKMALSHGGIILADVCALNLFSLRWCGIIYKIKTGGFSHLLLSQFLCLGQAPLLASSASLLLFQAVALVIFLYRVGNICHAECFEVFVQTLWCMARNASFPKVRFEEFCSVLQSAVVYQFPLVAWQR